jgi:UDP-glucose 4-epimerase
MGGGGFIGSHLADSLLKYKHDVTIFDHPNSTPLITKEVFDKIRYAKGDFNCPSDIDNVIKDKEIIFHLISTTLPATSNKDAIFDIQSNVINTITLLNLAVEHKIKKLIFSSSGGTVYGIPKNLPINETHPTDPICSYGISKLTIEKYLALYYRLHGLNYSILRFGNPYGERQRAENVHGVIPVFLNKILHNETIEIWGDGSVARDFIYISDVIDAMIKVCTSSNSEELYNISGGQPYTLLQILSIMEKVTGRHPKIRFSPSRNIDVPINYLDISKIGGELNWQPIVSIENGIDKTWKWIKAHH